DPIRPSPGVPAWHKGSAETSIKRANDHLPLIALLILRIIHFAPQPAPNELLHGVFLPLHAWHPCLPRCALRYVARRVPPDVDVLASALVGARQDYGNNADSSRQAQTCQRPYRWH